MDNVDRSGGVRFEKLRMSYRQSRRRRYLRRAPGEGLMEEGGQGIEDFMPGIQPTFICNACGGFGFRGGVHDCGGISRRITARMRAVWERDDALFGDAGVGEGGDIEGRYEEGVFVPDVDEPLEPAEPPDIAGDFVPDDYDSDGNFVGDEN